MLMVNSLISSPYFVYPLVAACVALISYKIIKVAIPTITNLTNNLVNNSFVINVRALFCKKCASNHLTHIFMQPLKDQNVLEGK